MEVTLRLVRISACSQGAISMPLILLDVSVKVTHVDKSLDVQPKGYLHTTYPAGGISESYS